MKSFKGIFAIMAGFLLTSFVPCNLIPSGRNDQETLCIGTYDSRAVVYAYSMMTRQYLLHQQVFSNGSVASVIDLVRDRLPGVAKKAGVSLIMSKWELPYADPSVRIVDLTDDVIALFHPENMSTEVIRSIRMQEPIPIQDISVAEVVDMWKGFEPRLKKHD
jgi:hypothetical protein